MYSIVRKTLETYLRERRVVTLTDLASEVEKYSSLKDAVFVTLYYQGRVIASSGRISCRKENSVYECIDNTLLCLKDPRFTSEIQDVAKLGDIHIRTDRFGSANRRVMKDIKELDTRKEGLIFLSQNLGVLSVILPNMVRVDPTPEGFFALVTKKAGVDTSKLTPADYVLYGFTTTSESDFEGTVAS